MNFGMFYIMPSPAADHGRRIGEMLEQIEYAEELGYDSVWLAEHHCSYGIIGNPAVALAAIAQRTNRIRIGTAVSVLPFQNPIRIAEDYALVDQLSGGRLDFGAGRGSIWLEYQMMQADRENSKAVFWESLDLIRALWSGGGPVSVHGEHFQFDDIESYPRPVQQPIPTWVAAVSPDTFPRCAERGLQIMTAGVGEWEEFCERTVGAARILVEGGHNPESIVFPHSMNTYLAETRERARAEYAGPMWAMHELTPFSPFGSIPKVEDFEHYRRMNERLRANKDGESLLNEAIGKKQILVDDPEGARRAIRDMRDSFGLDYHISATMVGDIDHKLVLNSMKLFAEEVIPEFRASPRTLPNLLASAESST